MLIGGVQDRNKSNNVQMLYYRQEARDNNGERPRYEIRVEAKEGQTDQKEFELILNKAQIETEAILRTVITYEDSY